MLFNIEQRHIVSQGLNGVTSIGKQLQAHDLDLANIHVLPVFMTG